MLIKHKKQNSALILRNLMTLNKAIFKTGRVVTLHRYDPYAKSLFKYLLLHK